MAPWTPLYLGPWPGLESGLKSLNFEKESFGTKNYVFPTCKSQNASLSGSILPL